MIRMTMTCPSCSSRVDAGPDDVLVVTGPHDASGKVVFRCTACQQRVSLDVDGHVTSMLVSEGVPAAHGHPSMGRRPAARPPRPALTYDDLLDLHLLLQQPDWFERLTNP